MNPGHATKFREIANAYAVLSNIETRQDYDAGISGGDRAQASPKRPFNAEDIFKDFFDQQAQQQKASHTSGQRGEDIACVLKISFWEACQGTTKRVPRKHGEALDVNIPAGVEEGQILRLKGQGQPGAGGHAGDLFIEVHIASHPSVRREGKNIFLNLPLTLDEMINGAIIEAPTPQGPVRLTIPAQTKPGTIMRLEKKGIKPSIYDASGDTFITLELAFPEKMDQNFQNWVKEWYTKNPHDPRKHIK
jgi:DnaJ-class molecular chaperone